MRYIRMHYNVIYFLPNIEFFQEVKNRDNLLLSTYSYLYIYKMFYSC